MKGARRFGGAGRAPWLLAILPLAAVSAVLLLLLLRLDRARHAEAPGDGGRPRASTNGAPGPAGAPAAPSRKHPAPESDPGAPTEGWGGLFAAAADRFASARTLEERIAAYAGLRDRLLAASDPLAAAEAIAAFLATGRDEETGLDFLVGNDGFLDSAPTLRTALLDLVAELDAGTALRLAREIMDARTAPDEYAIALRNLGWSPLAGAGREAELTRRFGDLLDEKAWLASPSAGFLEAFDAAVALSNRAAILDLASVAGLEDEAGGPVRNGVNEAASLALDRIMLRAPDRVVEVFAEDPSFLAHRPGQRASLLARLDLRKGNQFERFRDYLEGGAHAPGELDSFAGLFPNTAFSYGHRLISDQEAAPSIAEMEETDRAFLRILAEARDSGALSDSPAVRTILANLQSYLDEAAAAARLPVDSAPALGEPAAAPPALPRNPGRSGAPGRIRMLP